MKYNISFKRNLILTVAIAVMGFFTACDDSIDVTSVDENQYTTSSDAIAYLVNNAGKRESSLVEFRNQGQAEMYLSTSKNAETDVVANLKFEEKLLQVYNDENNTDYALFPKDLVSFGSDFQLVKGSNKSEKTLVNFITSDALQAQKTYVIPVRVEVKSGNMKLSEKESTYLIFVKDFSTVPTVDKASGIKIISCMEVNDTNPLNNLCFTLKESGKPLIDIVILFSANINYNNETGKVYIYNNPNVQHILDNREKYLKPLQDRGMKIVLGILGNHDRAGVSNLADETAKVFAQELKVVCDSYHLDGIFIDDEYSAYQNPVPVGFVSPSSAAASRLCFEAKLAMPDRLVCSYAYGSTSSLPDIDGQQSGTFVDYGIHDYGGSSDLSTNYPGMPKAGMALYSQEFSRGYWTLDSNLENMRNDGYGAHMIFAMDPFRSNFDRQKQAMESIADKLFDDELVYNENPYKKDW
ncbi:endo-beta-N-acetylglucosaminidase F1 [Labilibaculum filiforme]|uniref:Endo-beta-N-acetylglucosaminidase F1 n=2 Tax=Labilibaculum filiforme TaxID=1940526 RepID=A0A2N3HXW5_9BACT|nr:endo-beta-N-acetylglucosaminidase F1 [Labilibaculum filiforme]